MQTSPYFNQHPTQHTEDAPETYPQQHHQQPMPMPVGQGEFIPPSGLNYNHMPQDLSISNHNNHLPQRMPGGHNIPPWGYPGHENQNWHDDQESSQHGFDDYDKPLARRPRKSKGPSSPKRRGRKPKYIKLMENG